MVAPALTGDDDFVYEPEPDDIGPTVEVRPEDRYREPPMKLNGQAIWARLQREHDKAAAADEDRIIGREKRKKLRAAPWQGWALLDGFQQNTVLQLMAAWRGWGGPNDPIGYTEHALVGSHHLAILEGLEPSWRDRLKKLLEVALERARARDMAQKAAEAAVKRAAVERRQINRASFWRTRR